MSTTGGRLAPSRDGTVSIDALLLSLGFDNPGAAARAREMIEAAGLTRAGKTGISAAKSEAAAAATSRLVRVCDSGACRSIADASDGEMVEVANRANCSVCRGSNNRRAWSSLEAAMARRGLSRLCVVGGTSALWCEIREMNQAIELHFVEGVGRVIDERRAAVEIGWAQVVVLWAPTPLDHKVSNLFTGRLRHPRTCVAHRRGIEGLVEDTLAALR